MMWIETGRWSDGRASAASYRMYLKSTYARIVSTAVSSEWPVGTAGT